MAAVKSGLECGTVDVSVARAVDRGTMSPRQPLHPSVAIAEFREHAASADTLLRAVARHGAWFIGGEPLGGNFRTAVFVEDDGTRTLRAYSSAGLHADAARAGNTATACYALPGWRLLASLAGLPIDRVSFDAASAASAHYNADQFELLAAWAATAAVEEAVAGSPSISAPFATLGTYEGWVLLHEEVDGMPALVMAPDADGRRLAAVFTAHDAAEAFRVAFRTTLGSGVDTAYRRGRELFAWLESLPIEGFVVNPGPLLAPRAFTLAVCEPILRSTP
jgi:hypothetical protein